jgi:hypothetical protein
MDNEKKSLILKHRNNTNNIIFKFYSQFFTNKFYNIIYNLAVNYHNKNNLSLSDNYINICDTYIDSLIINDKNEEEKKGKLISNFTKILFESYIEFIDNQIINIDEFILKTVQSFLPSHHHNEIYIKNKKNVSIAFHSIITNISQYIYDFLKDNLNMVLDARIKENELIIQNECIYILCKIREQLECQFNKIENNEDEDNDTLCYDELIKTSELYINLEKEKINLINENNKFKTFIKELIKNNKKLINDSNQLKKLLQILNNKVKNNIIDTSTNVNDVIDENDPFSDLLTQ